MNATRLRTRLLQPLGIRTFLVGLLLYSAARAAPAQSSEEVPGAQPSVNGVVTEAPAMARPSLEGVRVASVRLLDRSPAGVREDSSTRDRVVRAGIGDLILIQVRDLARLTNHAKCLTLGGTLVPDCREEQIALYLDGREIKGLIPESGAPLPDEETVQFHMQRTPDSDEAWADLLGAPPLTRGDPRYRPTKISVGLTGMHALPSDVDPTRFELIRFRGWWLLGTSVIGLIALVVFGRAAARTGILRDGGVRGGTLSLSRCQMAFWLFLTVASFMFIWLVTGAVDVINGSVLTLMGIGAGTLLFARAIDTSGEDKTRTGSTARQKELLSQIEAELGRLHADAAKELASLRAKMDRSSPQKTSIVDDLLSDAQSGIAIHRFQMVVWTLVLGAVFLHSVWHRLSMPEFSPTLLALMGISSGTYLGLKTQENKET